MVVACPKAGLNLQVKDITATHLSLAWPETFCAEAFFRNGEKTSCSPLEVVRACRVDRLTPATSYQLRVDGFEDCGQGHVEVLLRADRKRLKVVRTLRHDRSL